MKHIQTKQTPMKQIQKYILGITLIGLTLIGGYIFFYKMSTPEHTPVTLSREVKTAQASLDTIERLRTYSGARTDWGVSPFGSGAPLIDTETTPRLVFHKPNTEWKTRTLSRITYVFGEGNPREVAVTKDKIEDFYACRAPYENRLREGVCPETQYVTREVEYALLSLLKNPIWENVVGECRESFRATGGIKDFDLLLASGNSLDINVLLIINIEGRKALAWSHIYNLTKILDPEPYGDPLGEVNKESACYKERLILSTMMNNILTTYNIGFLTEERKL